MKEINKSPVASGIKAYIDYGETVPEYKYPGLGVNVRFVYENEAQKKTLKEFIDGDLTNQNETYKYRKENQPGEDVYLYRYHAYLADNQGKFEPYGTQIGGITFTDNIFFNGYLKRFIEFDKMSVTIDNITINGKFDEIAQKTVAAKVAEMKLAYEKNQTQSQNKNQDNGMEM